MQLPKELEVSQSKQQSCDQGDNLLCLHGSPFVRAMYLGAGILALILGVVGMVLPILPTTPFILLAAACFARGSKYFYLKLLANQTVGPIILEWRTYHSIPRPIKRWIYLLMILSFGISILMVSELWLKLMLIVIGIVLVFFIWRIPVRNTIENLG